MPYAHERGRRSSDGIPLGRAVRYMRARNIVQRLELVSERVSGGERQDGRRGIKELTDGWKTFMVTDKRCAEA